MNYIKEVNAFYDWLETNSMAVSSIVLWHALMHICNKAGWPKEFTVAVLVLSAKTGLERRTIYNARNELKQKGRIDFKERKGNLSAVYSMVWFCDYSEYENCGTKFAHKNSHNGSRNFSHNRSHSSSLNVSPLNKALSSKISYLKETKLNDTSTHALVIQKLIDKHGALFLEKFGSVPVIDKPKDYETLNNLLNIHNERVLSLLLNDFFRSTDSFIAQSGYGIGVFESQVNKLLIKRRDIMQELQGIDFEEYPGGPSCKCGGEGIIIVFDPTANNGIGTTRSKPCPCINIKKLQG